MTGRPTRARRMGDLARPSSLGLMGERCYCGRLDMPDEHQLRDHPEFIDWLRGQVLGHRMTPSGRLVVR